MTHPDFLSHREGDAVAVAVRDINPGPGRAAYLSGGELSIEVVDEVPLGHKVALRDIAEGEDVIEYGLRIGTAVAAISKGQHVHVHNVRSARWQTSVA